MDPTQTNNNHEPRFVKRDYNEMCLHCHGKGVRDGETCPVCEGYKIVNITKEIYITIKPVKK